MSEVTIDLVDLKLLVRHSFEQEIQLRTHAVALSRIAQSHPTFAPQFAHILEGAKLEARSRVTLRYRRLLEALESANDVGPSLKEVVSPDRMS